MSEEVPAGSNQGILLPHQQGQQGMPPPGHQSMQPQMQAPHPQPGQMQPNMHHHAMMPPPPGQQQQQHHYAPQQQALHMTQSVPSGIPSQGPPPGQQPGQTYPPDNINMLQRVRQGN